jgi:hypothetical protein
VHRHRQGTPQVQQGTQSLVRTGEKLKKNAGY